MRSRTFLLGLTGGAVGAALVILVLVLVFSFGEVKQETIVQTGEGTSTTFTPAPSQGLTPAQIYQQLSAGVVMVLSDFSSSSDQLGVPQSSQALGTGFVVDAQGYILTNAHVVDEQRPAGQLRHRGLQQRRVRDPAPRRDACGR